MDHFKIAKKAVEYYDSITSPNIDMGGRKYVMTNGQDCMLIEYAGQINLKQGENVFEITRRKGVTVIKAKNVDF